MLEAGEVVEDQGGQRDVQYVAAEVPAAELIAGAKAGVGLRFPLQGRRQTGSGVKQPLDEADGPFCTAVRLRPDVGLDSGLRATPAVSVLQRPAPLLTGDNGSDPNGPNPKLQTPIPKEEENRGVGYTSNAKLAGQNIHVANGFVNFSSEVRLDGTGLLLRFHRHELSQIVLRVRIVGDLSDEMLQVIL